MFGLEKLLSDTVALWMANRDVIEHFDDPEPSIQAVVAPKFGCQVHPTPTAAIADRGTRRWVKNGWTDVPRQSSGACDLLCGMDGRFGILQR